MKKRTLLIVGLLVAALLSFASAAAGDASDPLISLDYLRTVFAPKAENAAQDKLDASGWTVYDAAEAKWRAAVAAVEPDVTADDSWAETRLKQGDTISGPTGTQVTLLAGSASAQFTAGAVVDATDGAELASGGALKPRHRYLAAENTSAQFTVTSRTAVVLHSGGVLSASKNVPDYNAMASALKALSLFKGTDTGYGEGFDLELTPTRIQALVMLIRLLGEEDAALACTSPVPFKDVPDAHWGRPYIAYAYEKGYTNGVEGNKFAPDRPVNAGMYVEFILRALGYSDTTQTDISTSADRARSAGVITDGELSALRANGFLRADVVYLSWYALNVPLRGDGQQLRQKLEAAGVFSAADYSRAAALVTSARM